MSISKDISYSECTKLLKAKLTDTLFKALETTLQTFKYEGFDIQLIYKTFISYAVAANRTDEELVSDIVQLVALFHYRGNNIKGITKDNTNKMGLATIKELLDRYKVKASGKGQTITLPRISQIFPIVSEYVFNQVYKGISLPVTSMEIELEGTQLLFLNYVPLFLNKEAKESTSVLYLTIHNIYQTHLSFKVQKLQKVDAGGKVVTVNKEPLGSFYGQAVRYSQLAMLGSSMVNEDKKEVVQKFPNITSRFVSSINIALQQILDTGFKGDTEAGFTHLRQMRRPSAFSHMIG